MSIDEVKLREVIILLELIQIKSLRELARRENMQPGQVSKLISSLERKLGKKLLERSTHGIRPTPSALEILPQLMELRQIREGLVGTRGTEEQNFNIATSSFLTTHLIPTIISSTSFNRSKVRIIDLPPTQFVQTGLRGSFDFCLHSSKLEWPSSWTTVEVGYLTWNLYARASHPLLNKTPTQKQILDYPFVIPIYWSSEGCQYGDDNCPIPMKLRKKGHETSTAASAVEIIRLTDQLSYIPDIVAKGYLESEQLAVIKTPEMKPHRSKVYLSVNSARVKQSVFKSFSETCRSTLEA